MIGPTGTVRVMVATKPVDFPKDIGGAGGAHHTILMRLRMLPMAHMPILESMKAQVAT